MMKEYAFENGAIDLFQLLANPLPNDAYFESHKGLVLACHDIFINYQGGILLVKRANSPAKDLLWPIGGRIQRGLTTEESLKKKVKEECNLELENIIDLGHARVFLRTDPFGHGKGTDAIAIIYFGEGKGKLKLNKDHYEPTIVLPKQYTNKFRENLHPYVRDFMDLAIPLVK